MRDRIIDIGLTVLLVVVAFGITWTLFSLNRAPTRPRVAQPPATEAPAGDDAETGRGTGIVPLAPDADDPSPAEEGRDVPAAENAPADEAADDTTAAEEPATGEAEPADATADAPAAPIEPVPEGEVALERIGFSFVTGGAGACGIVLEPWRHVAVSRDLLERYGCGSEITVHLEDEKAGRSEVAAIVADTMNPVHRRTVNVYVGQDEPALQYGVTSGVLEP